MIFSDLQLSQKLERTEARANAAFVEARARLEPESRAEWIEVAGAYAMFDGAQSPITQTFGLGLFDEITDKDLEKLESFFQKRGAPVFHEISPLGGLSLMPILNERGYKTIELTSVLYQSLENSDRLDLALNPQITTRIIDQGEEEIWARTSAAAWASEARELGDFMFGFGKISAKCDGGFPFLAEVDGCPAATGMLFIFDDIALLAGASTIPESRRQGAQSALLAARLGFAKENGCRIAMMGTLPGSQSQRNAEKNGFRIAYTRTKWQLDL